MMGTSHFPESISPVNTTFSSASLSGTDIALPNSKAQLTRFGATPQLRRLALSGASIRRKRHENAMSIAMKL